MTSLRMAFLFSAGAALSAWPAVAQETAPARPEPALEALVAEALAQNPDVRALGEALDSARARPEQAQALPDPMVSVLYVNDGWSPSLGEMPMTTLGFMGSQTLPWPGKRARREELAARDAVPASERLERQRLTVAAGVRRAFWGLVLAEESLGVLREQAEVWKEAEGVARARYAVGQGAQQDVLRAQVEITRFEQLRAEQEAEVETRLAELSRLVGREVTRDAVAGARLALRPEPRDLATLQAQAEATLPELRAGAAGVERGQLAIELAQRDFKPDFTVQAGYMNRGGLDPMWQAGVGITLPLYRGRRHAAVAEAEARSPGGRAPGGGGARPDPLPHAGARRTAPSRRADGHRLRRRPPPAGAAVVRGLDRQLPGGEGPVPDRPRGALDALPRPGRPPARPRRPRAHQGLDRRGEPRGHVGDAVGRRRGRWARPRAASAARGRWRAGHPHRLPPDPRCPDRWGTERRRR